MQGQIQNFHMQGPINNCPYAGTCEHVYPRYPNQSWSGPARHRLYHLRRALLRGSNVVIISIIISNIIVIIIIIAIIIIITIKIITIIIKYALAAFLLAIIISSFTSIMSGIPLIYEVAKYMKMITNTNWV